MKIVNVPIIAVLVCFSFSVTSLAWEGYDREKGEFVEIEEGNLVRAGEQIDVFNWSKGEYQQVVVEDVTDVGLSIEVEVYDPETGESTVYDMDKD